MAGKPQAGGAGLGSILRDKRVLIGGAVVAGAGLVALVMRKGGSGGATQATQDPATLNTSGGDLYNALQDLSKGWSNDLAGFSSQLQNVSDRLDKLPGSGTGSQAPGYWPFPTRPDGSTVAPTLQWPHRPPKTAVHR